MADLCFVRYAKYDNIDKYHEDGAIATGCVIEEHKHFCKERQVISDAVYNYCCCNTNGCNNLKFLHECMRASTGTTAKIDPIVLVFSLLIAVAVTCLSQTKV